MDILQRSSKTLFPELRNSCMMRDFIFNKEKYTKSGKLMKKKILESIKLGIKSEDNSRISLPEFRNRSLDGSNYDLNSLDVEMDDADLELENLDE